MFRTLFCLGLLTFSALQAEEILINPSDSSQEQVQEALILAKPGDTIKLQAGLYKFTDGLSLDVDNVRLIGEGMDKTILSFADQLSGAQGLLVTSNKVVLKDFAIEDAKGDALKVIGADGIYMINLRTEWTGGPKSTNGAYGLYPVESKDVLIDGCVAIGASDAGIYV
ncbi:MAG: parallel beta-helix domain-containing protein, partial [SAR86 cluster bacterium]